MKGKIINALSGFLPLYNRIFQLVVNRLTKARRNSKVEKKYDRNTKLKSVPSALD
ncbi:MAG: hypothetical protein ACLPX5_01340 [Dissulfurispiraceae bacterium]